MMRKPIALGLAALAWLASPAYGQDLSELEEQFELFAAEDIVVSASKHEQKASEAPSAIYVITAREIRSSAALTLSDLLRRVPGFDVYRVNQGYAIIGARGQTNETNNLVLVLLDGREVNIELFGIPFVEQVPVTLDEIERIEVIRGPGSALYGANAFSGVVNIITKNAAKNPGHRAFIAAGSFGNTNLQVSSAGGVEDEYGYRTSARFRRAYLFSDPDDLDVQSASARMLFNYDIADDSSFEIDLAFDKSKSEVFTTIGELPADLFQGGTRLQYDLGTFRLKFFWNVLDEELAIQDPTLNPVGTPLNQRILTDLDGLANMYDLESQYSIESESNRLIIGGNVRLNSFYSDQLVDPYSTEYRFGLFLQDEYRPWDPIVFTAGGRLDYYLFESPLCRDEVTTVSCSGEFQTVDPAISPRVSIVYTPVENQTLRLSGGIAFRKPAFFERQMEVAGLERLNINFANPELPNEQITAIELGYVTRIGERVKLNVDTFFNQYENFIEFQPNQVRFDIARDADGNPAQVTAFGGELSTKVIITEEIDGNASYAYLNNSSEESAISADPTHKVNIEATYRASFGLVANIFAAYISERQWRISDPEKGNLIVPFTVGQTLGNYTVVDARLGYRVWEDRLEFGVLGKNLLDEHREFPGLDEVDVDADPFTPDETFGGEIIRRTAMLYLEGRF